MTLYVITPYFQHNKVVRIHENAKVVPLHNANPGTESNKSIKIHGKVLIKRCAVMKKCPT